MVVMEVCDVMYIDEIIEYVDVIQVGVKVMYDQGILCVCVKM